MRWLIVLPFSRPGLMGMDFRDELVAMGHEVRTFAYRRDNPLYKNRSTKATYQIFILRRLERACVAWRPDLVLVIKGGPVTPGLIRRVKARIDTRFLNFFPCGRSSWRACATCTTCRCTACPSSTTRSS